MKIVFVVNTTGLTGGIKVVLTHANNLQTLGNEVTVVHLMRLTSGALAAGKAGLKKIKYFALRLIGRTGADWFQLAPGVEILHLASLSNLGAYDCIVATANETAEPVSRLAGSGKKFYFIQDYEIWTRNKEAVDQTYRLPLTKIVISRRLKEIMESGFNQPVYGPVMNGVSAEEFACTARVNGRKPNILMLCHILPKKGTAIGLTVLARLKKEFPALTVTLFGAYKPRGAVDLGHRFIYRPIGDRLKELYCAADIFLYPCLEEGFGLTPMEAMSAGCAVVSTDVGAVSDYATDGESALIVKPGDPEALYIAARRLLTNEALRRRLAANGRERMKDHSWREASRQLESILRVKSQEPPVPQ